MANFQLNRIGVLRALSCALLSLVSASMAIAAEPARAAPIVAGQVVSVEGTAFIRADGRESAGASAAARPGDVVKEGDLINTSSNGRVKVLMKDKSIIDVGPSALFKIDQFKPNGGGDRQVQASMMYGTVRAAIAQKLQGKGSFKIRTPSATMGVRGTEFVVKSDLDSVGKGAENAKPQAPKTEITVLQGKVDVANKGLDTAPGLNKDMGKSVSLTAGNQITLQSGPPAGMPSGDTGARSASAEAPKVVTLDTKSLSSVSSSSKVTDNTFTKTVVVDASSESKPESKPENKGEARSEAKGDNRSDRAPASSAPATGGSTTLAALATAVATPTTTTTINVTDVGVVGTFTATNAFDQPKITQPVSNHKLHVVVIAPAGAL